MAGRMTAREAFAIMEACDAKAETDFHSLRSEQVRRVLAEADARGYRQPRNANGSRARYFWEYVNRAAMGVLT